METRYGAAFFENVSRDLMNEFPDMKGFSSRNLRYFKQFYLFYSQDNTILHQVGAELKKLLFSIPWRHHIEIFTKCKSVEQAVFYIQKTMENGWSRGVLLNFLHTKLFEAQGKSISNFSATLPL